MTTAAPRPRDTLASLRAQIRELQKPITVDDPRAEAMFAKAARLAEIQGYCDEYDYIATQSGAPSRDVLKAKGLLSLPIRVSVTVSVSFNTWIEAADFEDASDKAAKFDDSQIAHRMAAELGLDQLAQLTFDNVEFDFDNAMITEE